MRLLNMRLLNMRLTWCKFCSLNSFRQQPLRYQLTLGMVSYIINADKKRVQASWILDSVLVYRSCRCLFFLWVCPLINTPLLYSILDYCGTHLYTNKFAPKWPESMPLIDPAQIPICKLLPPHTAKLPVYKWTTPLGTDVHCLTGSQHGWLGKFPPPYTVWVGPKH